MTSGVGGTGDYAYAAIAFVVGAAAGFRGVYERYQHGSFRASKTLPGLIYVFSRGLVPATVFCGLYAGGVWKEKLGLWSLACGVALESILRTRFYVKQKAANGMPPEEIWRGFFDLVRWYQNLCLEAAAANLAKGRKIIIESLLGPTPDFCALLNKVQTNLPSWPDTNLQTVLRGKLDKLEHE